MICSLSRCRHHRRRFDSFQRFKLSLWRRLILLRFINIVAWNEFSKDAITNYFLYKRTRTRSQCWINARIHKQTHAQEFLQNACHIHFAVKRKRLKSFRFVEIFRLTIFIAAIVVAYAFYFYLLIAIAMHDVFSVAVVVVIVVAVCILLCFYLFTLLIVPSVNCDRSLLLTHLTLRAYTHESLVARCLLC